MWAAATRFRTCWSPAWASRLSPSLALAYRHPFYSPGLLPGPSCAAATGCYSARAACGHLPGLLLRGSEPAGALRGHPASVRAWCWPIDTLSTHLGCCTPPAGCRYATGCYYSYYGFVWEWPHQPRRPWPAPLLFRVSKATLGSGHTPLPTAVVGRSYLLCCYAVRTCWSPAWTSRLSPSLVLWPLLLRGSEAGCKDFTWGTLPVLCLQLFIFILFGLALSVIMHKTIVQDRFRISALSRQKCHQQLEHWDQY